MRRGHCNAHCRRNITDFIRFYLKHKNIDHRVGNSTVCHSIYGLLRMGLSAKCDWNWEEFCAPSATIRIYRVVCKPTSACVLCALSLKSRFDWRVVPSECCGACAFDRDDDALLASDVWLHIVRSSMKSQWTEFFFHFHLWLAGALMSVWLFRDWIFTIKSLRYCRFTTATQRRRTIDGKRIQTKRRKMMVGITNRPQ